MSPAWSVTAQSVQPTANTNQTDQTSSSGKVARNVDALLSSIERTIAATATAATATKVGKYTFQWYKKFTLAANDSPTVRQAALEKMRGVLQGLTSDERLINDLIIKVERNPTHGRVGAALLTVAFFGLSSFEAHDAKDSAQRTIKAGVVVIESDKATGKTLSTSIEEATPRVK
jgi:hypothetical protein